MEERKITMEELEEIVEVETKPSKKGKIKNVVKKHGKKVLVAAGIGAAFVAGKVLAAAGNKEDLDISDCIPEDSSEE